LVNPERDLDVVVFGATGVTGRQVARYLAETDANWGAAGRDPAKLQRTLADVDAHPPATITADVGDRRSLATMAARATVVLNLVGPYTTRGRPVIEACVNAGTHYVDLTGEIPFVREIVADFDVAASEADVKVVQVCGFEALPPDLAVQLAAETARERWEAELEQVDVTIAITGQPPGMPRPSDAISGGTFQSMAEAVGSDNPRALIDPAALIADPRVAAAVRERSPIELRPRRGTNGDAVAPMSPAAFINPAVIHRTAAVTAAERGVASQPFRYREGIAIGGPVATLPLRLGAAAMLSGAQVGVRAAAGATPAVRALVAGGLRRMLPSSGFGPAADRLEPWRWRLVADATAAGGRSVRVRVDAKGHPGYLTTARMLGEAGLLLAQPGATPGRHGCVTPALALGTGSIERFERAGLSFSVE
jgi:short subunit dehydrogenase-like uncharacterized protein